MGRREAPRRRSRTSLWSTPLNRQSTTPKDLVHHTRSSPRDEGEEARRGPLGRGTIHRLAEGGYVGATLAGIARGAGGSPGALGAPFARKGGTVAPPLSPPCRHAPRAG